MQTRGEGELDRIVYEQFFADAPPGVFVEVGAARPDFLSMSALYREHGWRVIAIEPNPVFCEAQRAAGFDVLEYACGDRDEDDVPFEVVDLHGDVYEGGPVSFESFSALRVKESYSALRDQLDVRRIRVSLRRLDTILAAHAPDVQRIDVLSVDVEGWELEVLAGFSLERFRPAAMIVENLFDDVGYHQALAARGYRLWRRVAPNDVYVPVRSPGRWLWRRWRRSVT